MERNLTVSIIMPVYKTEYEVLKRSISSVISQSYPAWQLVVIDDNTCGDIWYLVTKRLEQEIQDHRIKFLYHSRNQGANKARNDGIHEASGKLLAFLDADDKWEADYLEMTVPLFADKTVGLVYSSYWVDNGSGRAKMRLKGVQGNIYTTELRGDALSPSSAVLISRMACDEAGGFDNSLPARQDYDLWLRISKHYLVKYQKLPLVTVYRDGHECISQNHERVIRGTESVLQKILCENDLSDKQKADIINSHYLKMMVLAIKNRDRKYMKKYYGKLVSNGGFLSCMPYIVFLCFPGLYTLLRTGFRKIRYR